MISDVDVLNRRKELRDRKRMIYNEDGATVSLYNKIYGDPITAQSVLAATLSPHRGVSTNFSTNPTKSEITTFVVNTGFNGETLHKSNIPNMYFGAVRGIKYPENDRGDATQELYNNTGKDLLEIAGDFFDSEPVELFYEVRVNDQHDDMEVYSRLSPIKQEYWDSGTGLLANGVNNCLDFDEPKARQLMLDTVLEVVNNPKYKINGVCLSFFRYFGNFKNVVSTGVPWSASLHHTPTSQAQIDIMTEWLYAIRQAMDERSKVLMAEGKEPLLLMIKVADAQKFNKMMGLDVDKWMSDDAIDILVTSGENQFNLLRDSVMWGKRYGVCVCPTIQDVKFGEKRLRYSEAGFRGRVMQVLGAGAHGAEFFNFNYNRDTNSDFRGPSGSAWRALTTDKIRYKGRRIYYQTYTTRDSGSLGRTTGIPKTFFYPHSYIPVGYPEMPWDGKGVARVEIYEPRPTSCTLKIYCTGVISSANFNGQALTLTSISTGYSSSIPVSSLIYGINELTLTSTNAVIGDLEYAVSG